MTERLDRIEAILDRLAEQQVQSQERFERQFERTQQQIDSNARSIEANSNAIAELRDAQQDFRASIEDVVGMITGLAQQADQDRIEFRNTVQRILDALTQRFSGNGQS